MSIVRHVRVWDAEGRCKKGHLHFARSHDSEEAARVIVQKAIDDCDKT